MFIPNGEETRVEVLASFLEGCISPVGMNEEPRLHGARWWLATVCTKDTCTDAMRLSLVASSR